MLTTCPGLHSTAGSAGISTRDLLIASPASYRYATEPHITHVQHLELVTYERSCYCSCLQEIIIKFARVPEPEFPGHVLLEQYQAQVSCSLYAV